MYLKQNRFQFILKFTNPKKIFGWQNAGLVRAFAKKINFSIKRYRQIN